MSDDDETLEMLREWHLQIDKWDAARERGHELRTSEISELMMMAFGAAEIAIAKIVGAAPAITVKPTTGE